MSNLILIVGHTGQGKTTFVKKFLQGKKHLIFDVNNEYSGYNRDLDLDHLAFVSDCLQNVKGTNIVFEDATGFFEGRINAELSRLMVQKRHSKNNLIFLFHSITDIPPKISRLSNYLVLFKTLDQPKNVERKYPLFYPYYLKQRASKNRYTIFKLI